MMKITQKKLKAKHFRYLNKRYVTNPDLFLKEIVQNWGINWPSSFNYLINSSVYAPMRAGIAFEYGFMLIHLGQMLEMGYIITKLCELEPASTDDVFECASSDLFIAEIEEGNIFPEKVLRQIFGFRSMRDWYDLLHNLSMSRDVTGTRADEVYFGIDIIPIRELLVQLPKALLEIHHRGGLKYCLPIKTDQA